MLEHRDDSTSEKNEAEQMPEMEGLRDEVRRLKRKNRRLERELASAKNRIESYKSSVQGSDNLSRIISAEKAQRDLYISHLLEATPEIVIFLDEKLRLILCSQAYLRAVGAKSIDQVKGLSVIEDRNLTYPVMNGEEIAAYLSEVLNSRKRVSLDIRMRFAPESPERDYKLEILPICTQQDRAEGLILLFNDLTDLLREKKNAEQASRAKGDFLSRMSHEMRTPMNAIIGMTNIAKTAGGDVERKDYCLHRIGEASNHLLGVINDILDMSKIEANKFELSYTEFMFEKMLMRVANVLSFRVEERKQNFIVHVDPDIPPLLIFDEQRLAQVITNLLSNAVKFTPEGGTVTLTARKLEGKDSFCTLQIDVADTGIGIPKEQQEKLFHSFEQGDGGISRRFGGTGLGLAISKSIVDMVGGEIWMKSEEGLGSTFSFIVKAQTVPSHSPNPLYAEINWDKLRILAVDASKDMRDYFKKIAAFLHFYCDVASDGYGACEKIRQSRKDRGFDIIFVDWKMPGMDGIELSCQIRETFGENTVVIMVSATEWNQIEAAAKDVGVHRFISKPLFPSTIVNCIKECLGVGQVAAEEEETQEYSGAFEGCRVLLAEDNEINREIVAALLGHTGLEIECAENGVRVCEMLLRNPHAYDMIFMDIHMPEMDGYEATRRIRAFDFPRAKSIPIVAMTANVFREDVEKCLEAGMNDHVGKPLDVKEVMAKLNQYVPRRRK